jgi:A/G-specific adenine glycosylase
LDFAETIERWYAAHGRDLPWRHISDPYLIWVSEIILQQTRVAQGYAYYQRFVQHFPTVEALAAASSDEVMAQWQGLGYYSRARHLHAAAKDVVAAGGFPTDYRGVRALRGVGDYTAAAICSFAYGLPCAVVDGNVYRVLSRYYAIDTPIDTTAGRRLFADLATELLDVAHPGLYNQALMDFGALQCTPQSPACERCPLSESCLAYARSLVDVLPTKAKRTAVKQVYMTYIYVTSGDVVFLRRRADGTLWSGLYEPVLLEWEQPPADSDVLERLETFFPCAGGTFTCRCRGLQHILTHRRLVVDGYTLQLPAGVIVPHYLPIPLEEAAAYPVSRVVEKLREKMELGEAKV